MSITTKIGNTQFVHSKDYSGNIVIQVEDPAIENVSVPCADVVAFVAEVVRSYQIELIEQMPRGLILAGRVHLPSELVTDK